MKWKLEKLSELCEINVGKTPSRDKQEYFGQGATWVSIADMNRKVFIESSKEEVTPAGIKNANMKIVDSNTVLFSFKLSVGKVCITSKPVYTNEAIAALPIKDSKRLFTKYLYYAMQAQDFSYLGETAAKGLTLNKAKLKTINIPLPPFIIQQKIATILDEADALRLKDKALLAKYDELLKGVFYDIFGDPVKNERGWETRKIGDLANISSGSTPSRSNDEYYGGDILWVKTTEVNGNRILNTEEKITELGLKNSSCKLYPVDSIILAMYGQGKTRGQVGILGVPATTNQACAVIQPSRLYNSNYLLCLLGQLYNELRNESRGGNQQNLNGGIIKDFEIIYPPLELQNNFSIFYENIVNQKTQIIQQQTYSESLFQSLMQRAFKGELVQ